MTAPARTVRLRIAGRVQGVGYRVWASEAARDLALRGWVRNRSDGSVEILVTGGGDAVAAMIAACRQGPPGACVARVEIGEGVDDASAGFAARPTE